MKATQSLKANHDFKRLYSRGKTVAAPCMAAYCLKNRLKSNRLGIMVGKRVGNAVIRNRVKRRIKEAYRINEDKLLSGYDIVLVGRTRCRYASFKTIEAELLSLLSKLGVFMT